jgi:Asp-tRNA(Asn)/Glu-tRNA(Gln) amidotransferase A subunit family amidase
MAFGRERPSATEAVRTALDRAALVESRIHAFAWLDPDRARRLAREMDARRPIADGSASELPLCGVPVGLKDVIDTAGVPTECGAALFNGRVPQTSASVALRLEAAGALILGKTVTAECAFFHPGPTRNPWNPSRTSGGSSMGSAAAVAAGIVPAALGTQTNGSVIRPAAFCGVVGFKPTGGRIPKDGVMRFSATLDQLGGFTRTVEDAACLVAAMVAEPLEMWWDTDADAESDTSGWKPKFLVARTAEWPHAEPAMQARFKADIAALAAAGAEMVQEPLPGGMEECVPVHRTIMQYEGTDSLGGLIAVQPNKVSDTLRRYVEEGAGISESDYRAALAAREQLIAAFTPWAAQFDAILTPPVVGEAPTPETTGDPRFCTRWTLVAAPAITLPTGLGPNGLPLGLQLAAAPSADRQLLRAAAWVERYLPAPIWTPDRLGNCPQPV